LKQEKKLGMPAPEKMGFAHCLASAGIRNIKQARNEL
jgi:hypothetical protein